MKAILRIIVILLVTSVVAGGFFVAVNNTSTFDEGGTPPAMTAADGQSLQPMAPPEGVGHDGGSVAGGVSGLLTTTVKLAGITLLVLVLEKVFRLLTAHKWTLARQ